MSASTSCVAGQSSSTRPPWFETTMPAAPASMAFSAPLTVMMPFKINGTPAARAISFNCSTVLLPAGGSRCCKNGRPAASMSMAMAKQPELRASAIFRATVALSHGLTVGMPAPPQAVMAAAAPSMTLWFVPSPVKAAMPAAAQAGTRILL